MKKQTKSNITKAFFEVKAPLTSTKISLYAYSPESLVGKKVRLDLTRSLKGKNAEILMKIEKNEEGLVAIPVRFSLIQGFIRRIVRKGVDYVEDSFVTQCRDGEVVVKPFLITRKHVSRNIRKNLRNTAKEFLQGHMKVRTAMELFNEIISNKVQRLLAQKLKKIYPLAACEIRVFEVIPGKKSASS
jgi:ribosomal protein S3AE